MKTEMITPMKKLLRYLADYKKECILGPLFKMLEATFELFVPISSACACSWRCSRRSA